DASNPAALPALGGAGGDGSLLGLLGSHGMVGAPGVLAAGGAAPSAGSDSVLPVETTGTWLTNSAGQVVILHGLNEVDKVAPYEPSAEGFGAQDAAFLAANGFNVVRLGVQWAGVEPEPGVIDYAYLASLAQTVHTLEDNGIYVILDMHQDLYSAYFGGDGAPAWAVQTGGLPNHELGFPLTYVADPAEINAWDAFWSNATAPNGVGLENDYAQMWEAVAAYFDGNPDVVGFEIMNEPWPGLMSVPTVLGSPAFDAQDLTPFYDQVASAIRAVDPTTPIFYEPNVLFNFGLPTHLGAVDATNTVFAFHDYCLVDQVLGVNFACGLEADLVTAQAQAYAQLRDIPAFMTEFGATDNDTVIADAMQPADQHLIGWTEWTFTSHDPTSPSNLVYNPQDPPVGANVDAAKLATLAQPYPQVVSGTPHTWSFDDGTFAFSYSTDKVDGAGSFAAGSPTTIAVPAIEFPHGYQVSVTGGQVVSAPDAPQLVIDSDPGATTVDVTVSPAAGG
ncbi:cellulase family glycosylhydrolase, partial [Mycobacterium sp.]|uniref:cellulase family glycosylhydrolase n=1 Tax=Mycobacterium sp. TaxID=1785 RepID=UPI00128120F3